MLIFFKVMSLAIVIAGGSLVWALLFPLKQQSTIPEPNRLVERFGLVPIIDICTLSLAFYLGRHFALVAALVWFVMRFWAIYRLHTDGWFWLAIRLSRLFRSVKRLPDAPKEDS